MTPLPCPTPWRISHPTYDAADRQRIRDLFKHEVTHQPYLCRCNAWHLTHDLDEELPTHLTLTPADIRRLTSMKNTDFRELVDADIKKTAAGTDRIALRHPHLHTRWRRALKTLLQDVRTQLEDSADDHAWHTRATAYQNAVLLRLDECRALHQHTLDQAA